MNLCGTASSVHVTRYSADEGFVCFNRSGHLVDAASVHRVPKTLQHEPSGLLSNAKIAGDLVGTDSVFAVSKQPHCDQPLVEWNRGVLENRADFNRELLAAIQAGPHQARLKKRQFFPSAAWTLRAVFPLRLGYCFQARHGVREVLHCFQQTAFFVQLNGFHHSTIPLEYV